MLLKVLSVFLLGCLIRVGAQDFYCPGQTAEFTCSALAIVKWQGSAFTGQCTGNLISFLAGNLTQSDIGNTTTCGIFTATITSLTESPTVTGLFIVGTSLSFTATLSLNGLIVQCEDGDPGSALQVNETLTIPETTTPLISVDQVSQDSVSVSFTLDDNRCVSYYNVNAELDGSTMTTRHSDTMSPVTVTGLDICQHNYSFVGYVTAQNGAQSSVSAKVDFTMDFIVINPIGVLVQMPSSDPILLWVHDVTPQYPTCVTGFIVTSDVGDGSYSTTVGPNIRSLTTEQLYTANFEYCVTIRPVVTPITGMGPLTLRSAMGSGVRDTYLRDPDFPSPMLFYNFRLNIQTVTLRISIQVVSDIVVPMRTYQYVVTSSQITISSPVTTFTGEYFEIDLGARDEGDRVEITVNFQDRQCRSMAKANYTVPNKETSSPVLSSSTINSLTVTVTLPLTEREPVDLQIISTINATGINPVVADFTRPGSQYTVPFSGLDPETSYAVTIRIVLLADNTVDVVNATTGTFMTQVAPTTTTDQPTPAPSVCNTGCIVGIVIVVFVALVVAVITGALSMWGYLKYKSSDAARPSQPETELREAGNIKIDPNTENNLAYEDVSHSTSSQPPVYEEPENWKPDPHT